MTSGCDKYKYVHFSISLVCYPSVKVSVKAADCKGVSELQRLQAVANTILAAANESFTTQYE